MVRILMMVAVVSALGAGETTPVRQCTGNRPAPAEVRVQGCTAVPCNIFQGTNAVMQVDFRAGTGAATLRPVVMATAFGVTIEYQLAPDLLNACTHLIGGSSCPLAINEDVTYNFVFSVKSFYPPIPVAVELSLINENGITVFCTVVDIHVRIR